MDWKKRGLAGLMAICLLLPLLAGAVRAASPVALAPVEVSGEVELFQCGSLSGDHTRPDALWLASDEEVIRQAVYDEIYAGLLRRQETITITRRDLEITQENLNWLVQVVIESYGKVVNDHPELFYVSNGYGNIQGWGSWDEGMKVVLPPTYLAQVTDEQVAEFDRAVEEAMALTAGVTDDVEKLLILHDHLVVKNAYNWDVATTGTTDNKMVWSAYGALVQGDAVCQGYALAYKLLLNKLGIDCIMVTSEDMNHAWNLVRLDGSWYHVDVTWDDPTPNIPGYAGHNYFLLSDDGIRADGKHYGWQSDAPVCDSERFASDWAFRESNLPFYRRGGDYYYVNTDEQYAVYRTEDLSKTGSRVADLSGNGYHPGYGILWDQNSLYYVPYATSTNRILKRYDLQRGRISDVGSFTFNDKIIWTDGEKEEVIQDWVGLALDDSGEKVQVLSQRRRTVVYTAALEARPAGPAKPAMPRGLTWGVDYVRLLDGSFPQTRAGVLGWQASAWASCRYLVTLYQKSAAGVDTKAGERQYAPTGEYFSTALFEEAEFESGTYYFTVQARGDGVTLGDSVTAVSPVWTYSRTEVQLGTPQTPAWDGLRMTWDMGSTDDDAAAYYEIELFFAAEEDETPRQVASLYGRAGDKLPEQIVEDWGDGLYAFRVRAISRDIRAARSGGWSSVSPALNSAPAVVDDRLDMIEEKAAAGEAAASDIRAAVQAMDRENLAALMEADRDNSQTAARLQKLELDAGITAGVQVDAGMETVFAPDRISVIGGGLNGAADQETVTLRIAPDDTAVPVQYHNAHTFVMHLEGAVDIDPADADQQLAVPVKVTLPLPDDLNPAFMVVLHYSAGSARPEEIVPELSRDAGGRWQASFVLTHFSAFALAEKASALAPDHGCSVQITAGLPGEGTAYAAAYSGMGRMMGVCTLDPEGRGEIFCDAAQVVRVAIFLLDDGQAPITLPVELTPCAE